MRVSPEAPRGALVAQRLPEDCHLPCFFVVTGLLHYPILKVSAWNNAMGAIAKARGQCNGRHGKKATLPKRRLGKLS